MNSTKTMLAVFAVVAAVSLITASGMTGTVFAKKYGDSKKHSGSQYKACYKRAAEKDGHLAKYEIRECNGNPHAFKNGH
jgi:hypothetical protein